MDDREIERLLAGQAPEDDAELAEMAHFFSDLERSCVEHPRECVTTSHIDAMAQAAQLLADKGEPVARPASKALAPAEQVSELPKWRGNPVIQRLMASKWARIAAITTALVLALGGTAFAGVLPTPVQDAVAGAAETVGVDLPDSHEAEQVEAQDADEADGDEAIDQESEPVAPTAAPTQSSSPAAKPASPPKRKSPAASDNDDEDADDADDADEHEDDADDEDADEDDADDEDADDEDADEDDADEHEDDADDQDADEDDDNEDEHEEEGEEDD